MNALILSAALDTNGQNARFVRAAERWGSDPDVLRVLALGRTDPAGVVARYQLAAEKYGKLAIRSAHRARQYFDFPDDILWDRRTDIEVRRLAREADIIHLNNSYRAYRQLGLRKPALLHHHGTLFRKDPAAMLEVAHRWRFASAVSTMDLRKPAPELLHWLPTAYDLPAVAKMRKKRKADGMVRVVSAPTNRELKATDQLEAAVAHLQGEGLPIELVLIEGKPWVECMKAKATADIVFDQVAFGYGCNAVEAWAMGIPVIAGGEPWTLDLMRREWGGLPFYEATIGTIADALRALVQSADLRAEWGAIGKAHAERFHAEKPALERLAELYHLAVSVHAGRGAAYRVAPVTFENLNGRRVLGQGGVSVFDEQGRCTTDDPYLVERLRRFAARRNFGVVEVEA